MIKIFIIEDDFQLRLFYERVLKQEGFDIIDTTIYTIYNLDGYSNDIHLIIIGSMNFFYYLFCFQQPLKSL